MSKEYQIEPGTPRTHGAVNERIQQLQNARHKGFDIFSFFRLRRIRQKIQRGDYLDDMLLPRKE